MYICICKAVNESAIRQAVDDGVQTYRDLSMRTGCGTQCGSCVKMTRQVLSQALEEAGIPEVSEKLRLVSCG
ncbi:MAG: (2Fe-2S)-binding protein [Xanthomonadales bacterium]|nr:(2Fe-2S)-binding protein [Gammaproteobacteria bacterium]MBT8055110.1 (2Fe-2S)-binding protein [Gammaproteobacteria bacterium]NND58401.1 (2Fe-2S)-binding protein [Xanthomonadales bacterium]NNK51704.1 (2Fe-2S)-binding protein [Xanthomonadales bacterium]NNL95688.1 (2Fe-2S)-binding protein [Xanthomonadales bacterium]